MENERKLNGFHGIFRRIMSARITGIVIFEILLCVVLGALRANFATINNASVIVLAAMITAVVGMAQMVIIATGGMNLAIGPIGGLSALLCAFAMKNMGIPYGIAILIGLGTGMLCGFINGLIIAALGGKGATSFLVTLAMQFVYQGVVFGITHAESVYNLDAGFVAIGSMRVFGLPVLFYVMLLIALLLWLMFRYTGIGWQILTVGANQRASELIGISTRRTMMLSHTISGLLAGTAGVMLCARLGAGMVSIGTDWMMFSFAAPIIGGTRQSGGYVSVWGTVLGALILATIENGMIHLNIDVYWMELTRGVIILLAVCIDALRSAKPQRAAEVKRHG